MFEILVIIVLAVLLIKAIGDSRQALGKTEDLQRMMDSLQREVRLLKQERSEPPVLPTTREKTVELPVIQEQPRQIPLPVPAQTIASASASTPPPTPMPVKTAVPATPVSPINFEQFLGVKLFAWVGGFALFLGIIFFVKYAFERNLIPPSMRVAMGYVAGLGLTVGGYWFNRRANYHTLAQTLAATGVLILFGVTYAAHTIYDFPFFDARTAFVIMALITAAAFLLAMRMEAKVVAVLGLLGGFLNPVLCSTGQDQAVTLFSYIALLDIGLIAVALRRGWFFLLILAAVGTFLTQHGWMGQFFDSSRYAFGWKTWPLMGMFLGFAGLFTGAAVWRRHRTAAVHVPAAALIMAGSALLAVVMFLGVRPIAERPGLLYGFVLLLNALVCLVAWIRPSLLIAQTIVAAFTFFHLCSWTLSYLAVDLVPWALVIYMGFGLLHLAFSVLSQRRHPDMHQIHLKDYGIGREESMVAWRPVLAAILPFLLLVYALGSGVSIPATPILGAALVLTLIMLWLAREESLQLLLPVALAGALAVQAAWHFNNYSPFQPLVPLLWYLVFYGLFAACPFVFWRHFTGRMLPWVAAALAGVGCFYLVYYKLVRETWPNMAWPGLIPLAFSAVPFASLALVRRADPSDPLRSQKLAWFGGVALLFVTLIVPVQFKREWITLGWALEGAALCWLFRRIPHDGLRLTGAVLLAVAFVRMGLNPLIFQYHDRSGGLPVFNWHLYGYGLAAAAQFAGAWWLAPPHDRWRDVPLRGWLCAFGGVLLFMLVNVQIADYFTPAGTRFIDFDFRVNFARDMSFSIAWGLFALVLLLIGFRWRLAAVRYAGLGLMAVTLLKLFLRDLSELGPIYRIGAFLAVAVIVLLASFLYQQFLNRDEDKTEIEPPA